MCTMKSEKLRRNFWLSAEIECMLDLIKEVKMSQGVGTAATTYFTFTKIANKMRRRGFPNKTPTQIRRKWFQMKSAYLCYKKGNVDRLFLIPEKFRSIIAHFVESGHMQSSSTLPQLGGSNVDSDCSSEPRSPPPPPPPSMPKLKPMLLQPKPLLQPKIEIPRPMPEPIPVAATPPPPPPIVEETLSPLEKFKAQVRQNNKLLTAEFLRLQESLMHFEQKCQTTRDNNMLKFLSN